jgi:3-deoxy-D-manno-octulosonic-acid transferase
VILYRILMHLLAAWDLAARAVRRDVEGCKARLGLTQPATPVPHVWVHAASNGEVTSAKPILTRLGADGRHVLLTVNTDSALTLARGWGLANVDPRLAPLDLPGPTARTYARWQVTALVTLESDLWPQRILACPGPVLVVGGRLTARSAKGWHRFERLARRVVGKITYLSAQDAASSKRFAEFGLDPAANGPVYDLKALYTPPALAPDDTLKQAFARSDTWLAASTHEGEDEVMLTAQAAVMADRPELKLILAPRHPKRADAIAALIDSHGLTCARRSLNEPPQGAQVYLADTLGEMALWYALAGVTFVAGSLTDRGGHTPYEPASFGSAILHGPDTANFKAAYERLATENAARPIETAQDLAKALCDLKDPARQQALGAAAKSALRQDTDIDTLMHDIVQVLDA